MTVADLIRAAFRTMGVLAAEEAPSAAEEANALDTLNDLLEAWAGERLLSYTTIRTTFPLTPSLNPHTLGVGGTLNITRPVRIDRASIIPAGATGTERPLRLLTDAEWQDTQGKTSLGAPMSVWVDSSFPLMSLYFNPVPNAADGLVLYLWLLPFRYPSTANSFDLAPGYVRAIRYNLAKELAPEYGLTLSPEAADIAIESKATLKRLNARDSHLRSDPALLFGGGRFNLISGDR